MADSLNATDLERALAALGELLAAERVRVGIVVVGGTTLNLLGVVERTTTDVDVIACVEQSADGPIRLSSARPFPEALGRAIRTVARDLGLDPEWMNAEVGRQAPDRLPPWLLDELEWRRYGGLDVGLVGRRTLIALKLYATVDRDRRSVHFQDLLALAPTDTELEESRRWVVAQDAGPLFAQMVEEVVADVRSSRS